MRTAAFKAAVFIYTGGLKFKEVLSLPGSLYTSVS